MSKQRFLVTGSSGFLGNAAAARLVSAGHAVIGLDPVSAPAGGYRHVTDDLSDPEKLKTLMTSERITHVIHAGGVSGPMVLSDQPGRVMTINVGGTLNLLTAALASNVGTFVFCSSGSAIGDYWENEPIGDDYPLRPTSAYGASKAAVDMMLLGLWKRTPLDLCSLRFTGVYGPGRRTAFVIDEIVAAALEKRAARVEAMGSWPYVFIDDAADATVAAALSERRSRLFYYVTYPEQVSLADLAAAAGNPPLEIDKSKPGLRRSAMDIEPAKRDFGFDPKIDHREGVRRMLAAARRA